MEQRKITDDLDVLMEVLPEKLSAYVKKAGSSQNLLEIVMDLGRVPLARFTDGEVILSEKEVTSDDINFIVERIGDFDADNRAGLERTLHRISAIRNRRGSIVGLTCRVGRAVYGTIDIIEDLIESEKSILILGKPGIGKTTMLREAARILAEKNRVIIVDTSNEIGGDGDVPHPAVGRARRMQVATPTLQHEVMIEAVENHNPEIIVIDEIGRELEAAAARTIAERGVQLIGTAHGRTMENLLLNPTLSDLVGGIESVTLSDEEARRRRTQKTVLERRSPPTFDVLIEIQERDRLVIHPDVAEAVDNLVRGVPMQTELRYRDEKGKVHIEKSEPRIRTDMQSQSGYGLRRMNGGSTAVESAAPGYSGRSRITSAVDTTPQTSQVPLKKIKIFPYGVARNRLDQAIRLLNVPAVLEKDLGSADVLITLRNHYRSRQQIVLEAEHRGMPIYVLRSNTTTQMENALIEMFNLSIAEPASSPDDAANRAQDAIQAVLNGQKFYDLPPASASVRRIQHEMARQANLVSHSYGKEPNRRVRIFRD